jgi:hypothetical protein
MTVQRYVVKPRAGLVGTVPSKVALCGSELTRVPKFKYLGWIVTRWWRMISLMWLTLRESVEPSTIKYICWPAGLHAVVKPVCQVYQGLCECVHGRENDSQIPTWFWSSGDGVPLFCRQHQQNIESYFIDNDSSKLYYYHHIMVWRYFNSNTIYLNLSYYVEILFNEYYLIADLFQIILIGTITKNRNSFLRRITFLVSVR